MTASKRFCVAPNSARLELTSASMSSSLPRAALAAVTVAIPSGFALLPMTAVNLASPARFSVLIVIWSVVAALAPTWKVRAAAVANSLVPLKEAPARLRLIS